MKLNLWKRILMFLHWLMATLGGMVLVALIIRPGFGQNFNSWVGTHMSTTQQVVAGFALLAVFIALTVAQLWLILRRGKGGNRGYIEVDSSETGRVRIAISAIEQMVRQSVTHIDGIENMNIDIAGDRDAIRINIVANIVNGSHVPTITLNMQRAIRQFVERTCGVAVRAVSISIDAVAGGENRGWWSRNRRTPVPAAPNPVVTAPDPGAVGTSRPVIDAQSAFQPTAEAGEADDAPVEPDVSVEPDVPVASDVSVEPDVPVVDGPRPIRLTLDPTPADPYAEGAPADKQFE